MRTVRTARAIGPDPTPEYMSKARATSPGINRGTSVTRGGSTAARMNIGSKMKDLKAALEELLLACRPYLSRKKFTSRGDCAALRNAYIAAIKIIEEEHDVTR